MTRDRAALWLLERVFPRDLSYALRAFRKAPGFALVAVLVLGVGIGANTAIFTIVNQMVFKPLSGRGDELVGLFSRDRTEARGYRAFSYANYADIREQSGIFDGLLAHTFSMAGTPAGDTTRRTFVQLVSSNFFDTLGVPLAAGRPFTLEEERPGAGVPVVIVPYERRDELGTKIRINAEDFTVVGAAPKGFTGTMAMVGAELYLPLGMFDIIVNDLLKNNNLTLSDRANPALIVAGRLKDDVSADQAKARLDALSRQLEVAYPGENRNQELSTSPLSRMSSSTSPGGDGGLAAFAALLLGLSGIVLVIACLNIANMLLARGAARAKEIALRLALGAGRARVIRQLLTESVLRAGAGAALGLVFGFWATRGLGASLRSILPLQITFSAVPDARVMAATIAFAALSTIAFRARAGASPVAPRPRERSEGPQRRRRRHRAPLQRAQHHGCRAGCALARHADRGRDLRQDRREREPSRPRLLVRPAAAGQPRWRHRRIRRRHIEAVLPPDPDASARDARHRGRQCRCAGASSPRVKSNRPTARASPSSTTCWRARFSATRIRSAR